MLRAGASVAAVSDFDLDLRSTLSLTAALLDEVAQGVSVAEAMRRARCAVAAEPRTAHPYYHAPLRILGLGHRALPLTGSTSARGFEGATALLWVLAASAVLGLAWWVRRPRH